MSPARRAVIQAWWAGVSWRLHWVELVALSIIAGERVPGRGEA